MSWQIEKQSNSKCIRRGQIIKTVSHVHAQTSDLTKLQMLKPSEEGKQNITIRQCCSVAKNTAQPSRYLNSLSSHAIDGHFLLPSNYFPYECVYIWCLVPWDFLTHEPSPSGKAIAMSQFMQMPHYLWLSFCKHEFETSGEKGHKPLSLFCASK